MRKASPDTSASDSAPSIFQYAPLQGKRSIRILELLPGPDGSPLQCRIIERSLESCGSFEALSYVWGAPELVKTIRLDDKIIRITRNCSVALHHLRWLTRSRWLWVDSICIDQRSHLERNHQVGMMGTIYSKALSVIVWLGSSNELVRQAMSYIQHVSKQRLVPEKAQYQRELGALRQLFEKPWFSRAWPVQEVAFSRNCDIVCGYHGIVCGYHEISAEELMNFLTLVKDYTIVDDVLNRAHVHRQMWRYIQHVRLRYGSLQSSGSPKARLTNCTAMLLRTQSLEATDPKDKIFAVHELLKEMGVHLPDPDYNKSITHVYRDAAAAAIRHDNRLHMLASITGESLIEGLPSWVPDWSCSQPVSEIASWDDEVVTSCIKPAFELSVDGFWLTLWGCEHDQIQDRLHPFPYRSGKFLAQRHHEISVIQGWLGESKKKNSQTNLVELFSSLSERPWKRLKSTSYLSAKTLTRYWIQGVKSFKEGRGKYYDLSLKAAARECAKIFGVREKHAIKDMVSFHELMRTLLDRKVVFRAASGYLGIASHALKVGDRIALFRGVALPMIVRRQGPDWRLVAPAFMQEESVAWQLRHVQTLGMYEEDLMQGDVGSSKSRSHLDAYSIV